MVKIPKFQSKFRTVRSAWPAHSRTNAPMIDFHSKMDERKPYFKLAIVTVNAERLECHLVALVDLLAML